MSPCAKLQVIFSGSDLAFGAGGVGQERPKKPHSCVCHLQYMTRASRGDLERESGHLPSVEDNSFLCSLPFLAHMYYTLCLSPQDQATDVVPIVLLWVEEALILLSVICKKLDHQPGGGRRLEHPIPPECT
ncbi:hypothetical protein llap_14060 [Limosa lapponica baueri]|uniref:Uncharacterized protein n=1 Tax=Limosa lapponica baueri TaxID=1758121 RepID=A0A2I0TP88_LIMLA|nr:hypothetical protein llap_14060 [Limosa lapponica baueri]